MSSINESINSLIPETVDFARDELKEVIGKAKFDNNILVRHIGELAEEYIQMRALDQLNNEEFVELMEDLIDLEKMQFHKISIEAKARAEKIVKGIRELVLNKLIALI